MTNILWFINNYKVLISAIYEWKVELMWIICYEWAVIQDSSELQSEDWSMIEVLSQVQFKDWVLITDPYEIEIFPSLIYIPQRYSSVV